MSRLITEFSFFLNYYLEHCPFTKPGQLEFHKETIQLRRILGSANNALSEERYLRSLYRTIKAWGIGSRGSILKPFDEFAEALIGISDEICALDHLRLDQKALEVSTVIQQVWQVIDNMQIVENEAKLVPCSKTLHHILPDLIVPIDREYTQVFFGWQNPIFQYGQAGCFSKAFAAFANITRAVNPERYVDDGWNSSLTKVIDNAIVGFILFLRSEYKASKI